MKLRVPLDEHYVRLIGKAVYVFAYYEWTIVYIIERLEPGFASEYTRGAKMTSGLVAKRLRRLAGNPGTQDLDASALQRCAEEFTSLVPRRNALIHAHPITDSPTGAQLLNFQSLSSAPITDMTWTADVVKQFARDADEAAVRAGRLLDALNPRE